MERIKVENIAELLFVNATKISENSFEDNFETERFLLKISYNQIILLYVLFFFFINMFYEISNKPKYLSIMITSHEILQDQLSKKIQMFRL